MLLLLTAPRYIVSIAQKKTREENNRNKAPRKRESVRNKLPISTKSRDRSNSSFINPQNENKNEFGDGLYTNLKKIKKTINFKVFFFFVIENQVALTLMDPKSPSITQVFRCCAVSLAIPLLRIAYYSLSVLNQKTSETAKINLKKKT